MSIDAREAMRQIIDALANDDDWSLDTLDSVANVVDAFNGEGE